MTLSPELLAMIKDVKPASDDRVEMIAQYMGSAGFREDYYTWNDGIVGSLIARIVAERKVEFPDRDTAIRNVVGLCNRIPGSTTWNAAEFMFDDIRAALSALEERGS